MTRVLASLRRASAADAHALAALQRAAYGRNRALIGREPLPLMVDYEAILRTHEVWLAEDTVALLGALVLEQRPDHLLVWSVAIAPDAQGKGLGNRLLAAAEERARELDFDVVRLYTARKLVSNVAWYQRHGFAIERIEALSDRELVHMAKTLS